MLEFLRPQRPGRPEICFGARYYGFGDSVRARCLYAVRRRHLCGPTPLHPRHWQALAGLVGVSPSDC